LYGLRIVVSVLELEVFVLQSPDALVQLGAIDLPVVDAPRPGGILEADDVHPSAVCRPIEAGDVRIGSRELLLDLDVTHREDPPEWNVRHDPHVGASELAGARHRAGRVILSQQGRSANK